MRRSFASPSRAAAAGRETPPPGAGAVRQRDRVLGSRALALAKSFSERARSVFRAYGDFHPAADRVVIALDCGGSDAVPASRCSRHTVVP